MTTSNAPASSSAPAPTPTPANGYVLGKIAKDLTEVVCGLSRLQRTILEVARKNVRNGDAHDGDGGADVYYWEVLVVYWGWKPERYRNTTYFPTNPKPGFTQMRKGWGWKFNKATIGEKSYVCAQAALSRAMKRLQERGLVALVHGHSWSGANLVEVTP